MEFRRSWRKAPGIEGVGGEEVSRRIAQLNRNINRKTRKGAGGGWGARRDEGGKPPPVPVRKLSFAIASPVLLRARRRHPLSASSAPFSTSSIKSPPSASSPAKIHQLAAINYYLRTWACDYVRDFSSTLRPVGDVSRTPDVSAALNLLNYVVSSNAFILLLKFINRTQ
ncbi:hypothetical protein GWI33_016074 [Rhynchophorus ferrugineus]|uniref:Uncharacterized protein n=1 Tax=Rhynchophorus ferrugineus TaxID=354439 RepID=A0A834I0Y2_RHYFE|nr:hypothetical protein GWI33_016074 [Rhynchophorus ferrugineus]